MQDCATIPPCIGSSLLVRIGIWALLAVAVTSGVVPTAMGQDPAGEVPVDSAMIESLQEPNAPPEEEVAKPRGIHLLTLIGSGGKFMLPIGFMSLLVVTLGVERFVSLRRERVIPRSLVQELTEQARPIDSFDPHLAYQTCQRHRSVAGKAIGAMLLRTGQPLATVERAATETIQREADRYSGPIRWLYLAAAATPLMGLLGTVWGMIVAFHESTTLTAGRSRSEQLSEGIYTALVTTLAGLIVAIPAAIIAQYLENRLGKLFHRVEELAFRIAPGVDRFHGRMRLDPEAGLRPLASGRMPPPVNPAKKSPTAKTSASAAGKSPTGAPQSAAVDEVG